MKDETVRIGRKESSAVSPDAFVFPSGMDMYIYDNYKLSPSIFTLKI